MPQVTVVIPTRNRSHLLFDGALRSALSQEEVDLEVVVVDEGSTDGTSDRLAALEDDRVRVVTHETARGLSRARNAGLAEARGEWVAFLDDDDLWAPHKLRTQLAAAAGDGASFVYSSALYVSPDASAMYLGPAPDPDELGRRLMAGDAIPAGGSNVLVRTEAIREAGGFDPQITHLADFDCWIRLDQTCRAAACEEPLLAYMQHPASMHLANAHLVRSDVQRMHRKYRSAYEGLGSQFDGEAFVRWVAHENAVAGRRRHAARVYLTIAWQYRSARALVQAVSLLPGKRARALLRPIVRRVRRGAASTPDRPESERPAPEWLRPYLPPHRSTS